MNLRMKMLGSTLVLALAVVVLVGMVGLFGSGGPPSVSAQTETGICDRTE